jgi:hypothetical protein
MDGETQLRALERKAETIGSQGGALSDKDREKLTRAKEIEKSGYLFVEERSDPILEAAYQRALARGDEDQSSDQPSTESSNRTYAEPASGHTRAQRDDASDKLTEEGSSATEEETIAEQLSIEQEVSNINNQITEVYQEGISYGKPSKFKYFILFSLAIIVDVIDLAEITGFGYFIAKTVAVTCTIIMYLIFWFTNTKQKKAANYQQAAQDFLGDLQRNIAHLERRSVQIARFTGKLSRNRFIKKIKPVRALRRGATSVIKVARRSPASKFLGAAIANLVPILDLMPWQVIGVWLSYRDENETYRDAATVANDLLTEAPAET